MDKPSVQFLKKSSEKSVSYVSERWKFIITENFESATKFIIHDHHLIKGSSAITWNNTKSTKAYSILISKDQNKSSSNIYFDNLFYGYIIDWTTIYMIPHLVTCNTYIYAIFSMWKLHTVGIKPSPLCSFCNLYDRTHFNIFYECDRVKCFWSCIVQCFQYSLVLLILTS